MNSDFSRIPIAVIGLGLMGGSFAKTWIPELHNKDSRKELA